MSTPEKIMDPLVQKIENYTKTSIDLLKLKTIDKTADVGATILSRALLSLVITMFFFSFTTGIALWLGVLLGQSYWGFLVVSLFYGITGSILVALHPKIQETLNNYIIKQLLK